VIHPGYYSYKFAEVLSADAFSAFEEAGLDDEAKVAETGHRFRDTVLALGGGKAPGLVFKVVASFHLYRPCSLKIILPKLPSPR
jgi:Zn-dependent oligopeptidase